MPVRRRGRRRPGRPGRRRGAPDRPARHAGHRRARPATAGRADGAAAFDPIDDRELWADFAADGRLDPSRRRPAARGRRRRRGCGRRGDVGPGARRTPLGPLRPGLGPARSSSSAAAGGGGSATRATGAGPGRAPGTSPATPWPRRPPGAPPSRPGSARSSTTRSGRRGIGWRSSTSCTSSSTAGRSGRRGEVGGPEPDPDDVGRFALLECIDYPFYDTVDVDFYASFALLELYPELEQRGIRDLLAAIPRDDPRDRHHRGERRTRAAQARRDGPPRRRRPRRRPVPSAQLVHVPGRQRLEGPGPEVRPPGVARRGRRPAPSGDALIRDVYPTVDAVLHAAVDERSRRRRPARARRPAGPDLRHLADAGARRPTAARCGSRRVAAAEAMADRLGDGEAARRWAGWFERAQVAFDRRLWRGRPLRLRRRRRPELGQRHGRPARRPVVRRCDRSRRPAAGRARRRRPADRPRDERARLRRRRGWARSTACARTGPSTSRASSPPRSGSGRPTRSRRS